MAYKYKQLTEDMYELIKKMMGIEKEQAKKCYEDDALREKIVDFMFDFECDEIMKTGDPDGEISEEGDIASDIVTFLSPKPPKE